MKGSSLITIIILALSSATGCVLEVDPDGMAAPESFELLAVDDEDGWATDTDASEHDLRQDALALGLEHEFGGPQFDQAPELNAQDDPDPTPWRAAADPVPDPWDRP